MTLLITLMSLQENLIAGESADKPGVHPRYRMSGMILRLSIEYTNGQPSIQVDKDVRAEVSLYTVSHLGRMMIS